MDTLSQITLIPHAQLPSPCRHYSPKQLSAIINPRMISVVKKLTPWVEHTLAIYALFKYLQFQHWSLLHTRLFEEHVYLLTFEIN